VAPAYAEPAPVAAPAGDSVIDKVIEIVAQLTGYPADLLDPDLDLEADLGVDTVKQAEVFAAVREHYNVERDDTMKLRDFPDDQARRRGGSAARPASPEPSAAPRRRRACSGLRRDRPRSRPPRRQALTR
jgi:acyl carrier protein